MTESILTISIAGLLAGFVFSMPVAGPISILVTTNALKGRIRYCNHVTIGASMGTFAYVFFAVFGLAKLYSFYKPAIPYLLLLGSLFLLYIGFKVFGSRLTLGDIEDNSQLSEMVARRGRGGFYTGFIINILNPTLFLGWLTSTFLVISFVASLGFNTGGLDLIVDKSVNEFGDINGKELSDSVSLHIKKFERSGDHIIKHSPDNQKSLPPRFHLLLSVAYALCISVGSTSWFYLLAALLNRFRNRINPGAISSMIRSMGIILCLFGIYFGYLAASLILTA